LRSGLHGDGSDKVKALNEQRTIVESIVDLHERMERIEAARNRMRLGTCFCCGDASAKARLRVVPWAERGLGCQAAEECHRASQGEGA
jgi:RNA polymerase-binding transcription factor DksA